MSNLDPVMNWDTPDWQAQNAKKSDASSMPLWQQYGLGSEAEYNAIYGAPAATSAPAAPAPAPGATTTTPAAGTQTFADYLATHDGSGDAWAYLSSLLNDYGLSSLDDWAQKQIMGNKSPNEVLQSMKTTEAYTTRFKAITERKAQGLPPISESEVINYEKQATQLMRSAGLPSGFWDSPDDFVKLQTSDISINELQSRITDGYVAAIQAPQDVRDQWKALGYTDGDLAAYMLDPTRTEAALTKQIGAVGIAAQAQRTGYGQLTTAQAERLQSLGGIDSSGAQAGFNDLANQKELFNPLPGEQGQAMSQDDQLKAEFDKNVEMQRRLKNQADQRVAQFKSGGGYTQTKEGFTGLSNAR